MFFASITPTSDDNKQVGTLFVQKDGYKQRLNQHILNEHPELKLPDEKMKCWHPLCVSRSFTRSSFSSHIKIHYPTVESIKKILFTNSASNNDQSGNSTEEEDLEEQNNTDSPSWHNAVHILASMKNNR